MEIKPPTRKRASERVFESLARDILSGAITPGTAIARQRELAERFGVSLLVVRQAIHSLEDLGLVRVRQGGATIALDPNAATDIRLVDLRVQLAPSAGTFAIDTLELRTLFLVPLLALAERRVTSEHAAVLHYLIDSVPEAPSADETRNFRMEFWKVVAGATGNTLIEQQVRWWRARARQAPVGGDGLLLPQRPFNPAFYRTLTNALQARSGAVAFYTSSIAPLLDWFDAQRASALAP